MVAWNKLYRKDCLQNTNIRFPEGLFYEDVEFFYKILPTLSNIGFVKKPLLHYVQRPTSISNTQTEKTKDIFTIFEHVFAFYKQEQIWDTYYTELEYTYTRYLLCSSLKRMSRVKDSKIRKELWKKTWENLNSQFPSWKKNLILHKRSKKNCYMRTVNKWTYPIYCHLFQMI